MLKEKLEKNERKNTELNKSKTNEKNLNSW